MPQELSVERVAGHALPGLWTRCTELVRTMSYPSFFCTGDWLEAAANHLSPEEQLVVLVVKEGADTRAVLPLFSKPNRLGGRDLHFLGEDFHPDPLGVLCASGERDRVIRALKNYLLSVPGWDQLILTWILEDELLAWDIPGTAVAVQPYMSLPATFDTLLKHFKQKKRYNLRALHRRMVEAGGTFVRVSEGEGRQAFLDALFLLHAKRAKERDITSSIAHVRAGRLHRWLVAHTSAAVLFGIVVQERPIAVAYGFEFAQCFFYYQIAHDPEFDQLSPGSVLLFHLIETCCARGLTEFNFLQGDEAYKWAWTKDSRTLYQGVLRQANWRARLLAGGQQGKVALKKMVEALRRGH